MLEECSLWVVLLTSIKDKGSCMLWLVFRALFIGWEKRNFCIFASSLLGATIWDSGIREKCNDGGGLWRLMFTRMTSYLSS